MKTPFRITDRLSLADLWRALCRPLARRWCQRRGHVEPAAPVVRRYGFVVCPRCERAYWLEEGP